MLFSIGMKCENLEVPLSTLTQAHCRYHEMYESALTAVLELILLLMIFTRLSSKRMHVRLSLRHPNSLHFILSIV